MIAQSAHSGRSDYSKSVNGTDIIFGNTAALQHTGKQQLSPCVGKTVCEYTEKPVEIMFFRKEDFLFQGQREGAYRKSVREPAVVVFECDHAVYCLCQCTHSSVMVCDMETAEPEIFFIDLH